METEIIIEKTIVITAIIIWGLVYLYKDYLEKKGLYEISEDDDIITNS